MKDSNSRGMNYGALIVVGIGLVLMGTSGSIASQVVATTLNVFGLAAIIWGGYKAAQKKKKK